MSSTPTEAVARRTAVVTGASSGIGRATVTVLAERQWNVVAVGRRQDRLAKLAESLPGAVHPVSMDVRDQAAVGALTASLPPEFRSIALLVNSAGVSYKDIVQDASLEDWNRLIETNIGGLVTMTHALVPELIRQRGAIINVSSTAANYPQRGGNIYGGTKAFISHFSLNLRCDLEGTGVRVTTIEPGAAKTELVLSKYRGDEAAAAAHYEGMTVMTADDVAEAICWVAHLPAHVNVNRLEMMPTSQAWAGYSMWRGSDPESD